MLAHMPCARTPRGRRAARRPRRRPLGAPGAPALEAVERPSVADAQLHLQHAHAARGQVHRPRRAQLAPLPRHLRAARRGACPARSTAPSGRDAERRSAPARRLWTLSELDGALGHGWARAGGEAATCMVRDARPSASQCSQTDTTGGSLQTPALCPTLGQAATVRPASKKSNLPSTTPKVSASPAARHNIGGARNHADTQRRCAPAPHDRGGRHACGTLRAAAPLQSVPCPHMRTSQPPPEYQNPYAVIDARPVASVQERGPVLCRQPTMQSPRPRCARGARSARPHARGTLAPVGRPTGRAGTCEASGRRCGRPPRLCLRLRSTRPAASSTPEPRGDVGDAPGPRGDVGDRPALRGNTGAGPAPAPQVPARAGPCPTRPCATPWHPVAPPAAALSRTLCWHASEPPQPASAATERALAAPLLPAPRPSAAGAGELPGPCRLSRGLAAAAAATAATGAPLTLTL